MLINIIFAVLSFAVTGIIYYFTGMYQHWGFYFLVIPILIVSYFIVLLLYMTFLYLFSLILKSTKAKTRPRKFYYGIIKETTYALLILARVKLKRYNTELIPKGKEKFLIITNHQSKFDPMVVFRTFKQSPIACITKPENLDIPIAGGWIKYAGFIPINRQNNFEAVKSISLASKYIKEGKATICVYPEGTRNFNGGVNDFHAGTFKIATKANCPIVICSTYNTKSIKTNFPKHRTRVEFKILKVLYPEDYKDMTTQDIAEYAHNLIETEILAKENANN